MFFLLIFLGDRRIRINILTNWSGCGSGSPKYIWIWILRIRIRNTGKSLAYSNMSILDSWCCLAPSVIRQHQKSTRYCSALSVFQLLPACRRPQFAYSPRRAREILSQPIGREVYVLISSFSQFRSLFWTTWRTFKFLVLFSFFSS